MTNPNPSSRLSREATQIDKAIQDAHFMIDLEDLEASILRTKRMIAAVALREYAIAVLLPYYEFAEWSLADDIREQTNAIVDELQSA